MNPARAIWAHARAWTGRRAQASRLVALLAGGGFAIGVPAAESASAATIIGPPLPNAGVTLAPPPQIPPTPVQPSATTSSLVAATATASSAAPAGLLTITVWLVRCPSGRFDPLRGEPDHLDRADFDRLLADGVLVIDDQVTATGAAAVRLHGERRQDLPKNTVYAATTDHVGLDLDVLVDPGDGEHQAVDLKLVRYALVKLGGSASSIPSIQTSTWNQHCDLQPGALRFVSQGIRPGSDLAQAVLIAVSATP